jgi:hypothetical protein
MVVDGHFKTEFSEEGAAKKQQQNCCPAAGMVQTVARMANCAEAILQLKKESRVDMSTPGRSVRLHT